MSANIIARPISPKKKDIRTMSPDSFIASMEEIFGAFPVQLREKDLPILRALAIDEEMRSIPRKKGAWYDIFDQVDKYGAIEVYAEY